MRENDLWLLAGRLATLLTEATNPPQGGGFKLRAAQALEDFDQARKQKQTSATPEGVTS